MPTGLQDEAEGDTSGQAGTGSVTRPLQTESPTGWPSPISAAALGQSHSLVVAGGRVMSFGLGIGIGLEWAAPQWNPTEIPGLTDVKDVCAGKHFSLALLNNGTVLSWGQLHGVGFDFDQLPTEVKLAGEGQWNGTVVGISCGGSLRAAWTDRGALYTWGSNENRQCCIGHSQEQGTHQMTGEAPLRIATPTQVEALKGVKVVGAVGYRDQLLILPEDPGMFFLCGKSAEFGKGDENESAVISGKDSSAPKVLLPSIRGLENHKVVGAALGEDQPPIAHGILNLNASFIILILEDEGRRRLFVLGADGKEVLTREGESLHDFDFSDKGGLPLDVLEVGVQKDRALVLLSDNSVRSFKVSAEGGFKRDNGMAYRPLVAQEPNAVEALRNSALSLAKAISLGQNWIVITKDGPMGPFLPEDYGSEALVEFGIGKEQRIERIHSFGPLEPPVLAKGGYEIPSEWKWSGTHLRPSSLPFSVKRKGASSGYYRLDGDGDLTRFEPYIRGTPIGVGWDVEFECQTGLLIPYDRALCNTTEDGAPPFFEPSGEVTCKGCEQKVPSWAKSEHESPVSPLLLEVKKNIQKNATQQTVGARDDVRTDGEKESEEEWREYKKGEAIGVGDRLRLRCASGRLVPTVVEATESHHQVAEQLSKGVECRWSSTAQPEPVFKDDLNETLSFHCTGCSVPRQWLSGERPKGSRYIVDLSSIRRAGREETESFQPNGTRGVAINDTLFFTCPEGGKLQVDEKARVRGGATCVNPLGREQFDLEVSDVKCVRSTGAIFAEVCLWTCFVLLLAVAVWVFVWYGWKETWRRRRIARRLNLQRLVVPPEGADVSEIITERPRSLAEQETRARRRAQ
uniref:Uncharacterized protein n=1 Tax=Chromera velia CCMP2878 TaxID=1169474 RepID=A0A0G4HLI9_9ALVE|eukprot:Cvel_7437.t1-p1 / transcript=Cvel_7437.t1 / gene=Cvel_7437 / organism=Chromera_velia_CCMP2878 / gene_product=Protein pim1, putative / transcript_product=Protein pim1, putative / location=Cvel_scaffold388:81503-88510(+) / protein_length=854 / sequence_SO=supercontig / SO=protein_coding / is_pseudo=false